MVYKELLRMEQLGVIERKTKPDAMGQQYNICE